MILGKNLIDSQWVSTDQNWVSGDIEGQKFSNASLDNVEVACEAARRDFRIYASTEHHIRAEFLRECARQIDLLGDEITATAMAETGLLEARLIGERGRTTAQLNMFADLIESTDYLGIRKDEALPKREPLPRPDLRLRYKAIGPVVVFGASNFPLAFSTAGGDTASALAAGCPVIVKGHPAHAGTAELVAQAIAKAIQQANMPKATFQLLQDNGFKVGTALVKQSEISAVGFTGSLKAGRILYDLCHNRETPIPFYGELGSVNPMFCLPSFMSVKATELATGWVGSLTMGAGQFCTNPGVVIVLKGASAKILESAVTTALQSIGEQRMLTDDICAAYLNNVENLASQMEQLPGYDNATGKRVASPTVFKTSAKNWMRNHELQDEVFGAAGIIVECDNQQEMLALAESLEGQLTATLHMTDDDIEFARSLLPILEDKAGRIIVNGFPTGVEVCSAMMHGGPYPASTDVKTTSVGTLAIMRWLRPISYQGFPANLLPDELQD